MLLIKLLFIKKHLRLFFSLLTLFFTLLIILPHESICVHPIFHWGNIGGLAKSGEFGKKYKKGDGHIEGIVYRRRGQNICTL